MPSPTLTRPVSAGGSVTRRPAGEPDSLLWSAHTLSQWAATAGVSLLVLLGSWYFVAGKADWSDQRIAMSIGIGSLVLVSFISINVLLAGRRRIGLRRLALLGELAEVARPTQTVAESSSALASSETLVGQDGLVRYHRSDCLMVAGRNYPQADRVDHVGAGRQPCGVCRP